jgi:hypothetical protein
MFSILNRNEKLKAMIHIYQKFTKYYFDTYESEFFDNDMDFHGRDVENMRNHIIKFLDCKTDIDMINSFVETIKDIIYFKDEYLNIREDKHILDIVDIYSKCYIRFVNELILEFKKIDNEH